MERSLGHVMLDIETLGVSPGCVVLSIAAVEFDIETGEVGSEFFSGISIDSSLKVGLTIDADTLQWWLEQDATAKSAAFRSKERISDVLHRFTAFMETLGSDVKVWGNGIRFDAGILEGAYKAVGHGLPFRGKNELDVRTLVFFCPSIKAQLPFEGTRHVPIDDCKHQIRYCTATFAAIKRGDINQSKSSKFRDALLGVAIGDALGVPFELVPREELDANPVTDMVGHRAHGKPEGTWSDDGSMTFCAAEALIHGFDPVLMGRNFVAWLNEGYWSADGKAFGSGGNTRAALARIQKGVNAEDAGATDPQSNGNGSLMRMIPLALYLKDASTQYRWECVRKASSITHGNIVACMACFYYVEFAVRLLRGEDKSAAHNHLKSAFPLAFLSFAAEKNGDDVRSQELSLFANLLEHDIQDIPRKDINSGSYVVDSLQASIWCLMTSSSYEETVLKAVNLGGDSDSTAAISGGLAGIAFGLDRIPRNWLNKLVRRNDIEDLADRFRSAITKQTKELTPQSA